MYKLNHIHLKSNDPAKTAKWFSAQVSKGRMHFGSFPLILFF